MTQEKTVLVIPARYGSTRLSGKPLIEIAGVSMIERVWRQAMKAAEQTGGIAAILVATDDERIAQATQKFGGTAVMTPLSCENGTERALAAIEASKNDADIIINLQGDAPLTPSGFIASLIETMRANPAIEFATPAQNLTIQQLERFIESKKQTPASGTTVVFDDDFNALYFSKQILPFSRKWHDEKNSPVWRHIGLYAYRMKGLRDYLSWPKGRLEQIEGLEQLRILEQKRKIKIVPVDAAGRTQCSVDSAEDVQRVEAILAQEGEPL